MKKKVILFGDPIIDQYIWGDCNRVSPEAPIPILEVKKKEKRLGGAANVLANLLALGLEVEYIFFYNEEDENNELIKKLSNTYPSLSLKTIRDNNAILPLKTRFISSGQQLLRTDNEKRFDLSNKSIDKAHKIIDSITKNETVLISDYNKGYLNTEIINHIVDLARDNNVDYICDPHPKNLNLFSHAYSITPNKKEASEFLKLELNKTNYKKALDKLETDLKIKYPCITLGSEGCIAKAKKDYIHIPSESIEVFDVTGAGDTLLAGLLKGKILGKNIFEALQYANQLAGLSVSHIGAFIPSKSDFENL